jgi:hypothetical protein
MTSINLTRIDDCVVYCELRKEAKQTKTIKITASEKLSDGIARNVILPQLANLISLKINKPRIWSGDRTNAFMNLSEECVLPIKEVSPSIKKSFEKTFYTHKEIFKHNLVSHLEATLDKRPLASDSLPNVIKQFVGKDFDSVMRTFKNDLEETAEYWEPKKWALREIQDHRKDATDFLPSDLDLPLSDNAKAHIHIFIATDEQSNLDEQIKSNHLVSARSLARHRDTKALVQYHMSFLDETRFQKYCLKEAQKLAVYKGTKNLIFTRAGRFSL